MVCATNIPKVLLCAQLKPFIYFGRSATLVINAFLNEDRLECRKAKHDPRRAPAREHSDGDLGWMGVSSLSYTGLKITYLFSLQGNVCKLVFQAAFLRPG